MNLIKDSMHFLMEDEELDIILYKYATVFNNNCRGLRFVDKVIYHSTNHIFDNQGINNYFFKWYDDLKAQLNTYNVVNEVVEYE